MFFHVIMTTHCNLMCRYCYGEAVNDFSETGEDFDILLPERIAYDVSELASFCSKDPDCSIIFYGGEPLLEAEKIEEIIEKVPARRFLIQTNGTLLHRLGKNYFAKLHTIAVSVDGKEETTDMNRGDGTFRRVVKNLKYVVKSGFEGEIIARMTVMEPMDIFEEVRWLLNNQEFSFSAVHWQLNAGFWNDFEKRNFKVWVEEKYNPGVRKLVEWWTEEIWHGRVHKIYPFLGVLKSLFAGGAGGLRCGAGWANYAIQTDGHIIPCPSMWGMRRFYLGHITQSHPLNLEKIKTTDFCEDCEIFAFCGGRCLYANVMKRWSREAYRIVCGTVKNLVNALRCVLPKIEKALQMNIVKPEDFNFLEFNGCEIIP
ncbi:MAG: TIGR04084 family radical SAM/SPASM domain-containing protein [Candidatus Hadarchaeales archaeon]